METSKNSWRIRVFLGLHLALLIVPGHYGSKCGYESCHKPVPGMLNVHLVPHTHDDVGWLKTVDQYYYGSQTLIQKAGVQYILDSVVQELLKDPNKRFIYVESAFFFKWWKEQDDSLKEKVKMLVNEGRLEFIGGAWSMNDEAASYYQSIIDQFALGLKHLNDTFGECSRPRIGWQIDPFGHSREMASIFAQMNYDGLFFGRLDYQDRIQRLNSKTAEMIWRSSPDNLGEEVNLFTGALYNQYQPPPGFCFDILCADEPIIDGKHSPDNNVDKRIDDFFAIVRTMNDSYRSGNILITMGEDFNYQVANTWYKNLDKLIKYGNARQANGSDINLLYSTPSCYLKALHDAGITWPTKSDDFFPYASDPHAYWTGYFTSRPTSKRYEREGNHFLQICKQLTAMAPENTHIEHLNFMKESMGIMQHHDAITGTEKQKVANDYARRLSVAFRACGTNTKEALNDLSRKSEKAEKLEFQSCPLLNISSCSIPETEDNFIVTIYNPLSFKVDSNVRFPVLSNGYQVFDHNKTVIESQVIETPAEIRSLKFRKSVSGNELTFLARSIPPFGYQSFYVQKIEPSSTDLPEVHLVKRRSIVSIGNKFIRVNFDSNGYLASVEQDGVSTVISQEFLYYQSQTGDNKEFVNRSSGAYIFRPKSNKANVFGSRVDLKVVRGPLVQEVHQKINDWISQIVRVYQNSKHVEFEWLIGPIPVDDTIGKEIITRYSTGIQSDGIFFTDSNGREMIKRKRNHRSTWNVKIQESVAGNYYPVTTRLALEDESTRMAIITDRAQGGSSINDGSLELMLHRRILHDDAFGVDEALNETAYGAGLVARGKHYLVLGKSDNAKHKIHEKKVQVATTLPPHPFFSSSKFSFEEWTQDYKNIFSGLDNTLDFPANILTLEPWNSGELLVRFEHNFEKSDDKNQEEFVKFNVKELLGHFKIKGMRETTLDGNQWVGDYKRLEFTPDPEGTIHPVLPKSRGYHLRPRASRPIVKSETVEENDFMAQTMTEESRRQTRKSFKRSSRNDIKKIGNFDVELEPMQIKTFILFIEN